MADVPHNNLSPYKHPLGRPPPSYEMMTVVMQHTWMRVLWGQREGRWSVGWKAVVVIMVE